MQVFHSSAAGGLSHLLSGMSPCAVLWLWKVVERHCRDQFLTILELIHEARVLHGDLRFENLLVMDSGEVAIIDFDRATMNAKRSARQAEYRALSRLLDSRVDDSDQPVKRRTRDRQERGNAKTQSLRRTTRSMGTARQTLGGMTLRPRR
jgi:tRNA A-37 threonylcarbamoyl transferase component Bud32